MSLHNDREFAWENDVAPPHPPDDAGAAGLPDNDGVEVRRWLLQAQIRPTALRIIVIRTLLAAAQPLTADALHRQLRALGETLCVASVYRVLRELETGRLLVRDLHKTRIGTKSFYRVAESDRPVTRYSLLCPHCGRRCPIVDAALANQLSNVALGEGFQLPRDVTLSLACVQCRAPAQQQAND